MNISPRLTNVTRTSRYLAFIIFISMPFLAGYIGYEYGKRSVIETVPTSVIDTTVPADNGTVTEATIEDSNDFYNIAARFPEDSWDTTGVIRQFVEARVEAKQTEWAIGGEAYQGEQAVAAEFPDRPKITYDFDIRYSSSQNGKTETRTYTFFESEMTGGANGNVTVATFTFNKNGVVTLEDIINIQDGNDITLSQMLRAAAVKQRPDIFENTNLLDEGLGLNNLDASGQFDAEKCQCDGYFFGSNLQNFVPAETGMTFVFSKFAIAPGVAMTPEITLSWDELSPYLTPAYAHLSQNTLTETYIGNDGATRLEINNFTSYTLNEGGTITTGNVNTERGHDTDPDATVYVLDWDKPAASQHIYVRYTTETNHLYTLDETRNLLPNPPLTAE